MKTTISLSRATYLLASAAIIVSCNKSDLSGTSDLSASSNTIAVAASSTVSTTSGSTDSVYLMQSCKRGEKRDSIAQSDLPSAVTSYISTNYSGSTFSKAFALKNSSSTVAGYVVVIYYNDKPVGLLFDSTGNFVKVLEQREKGDLEGPGFHHGGRFDGRDGQHRDTFALGSLPAAITSYFATNYSSDTLVKAFSNRDGSIVVLSKNNGVFSTIFSSAGNFIKRDQLPTERGNTQNIDLTALPLTAANYLAQTYPNYVFEKAFSFTENGTAKGYVVVLDANNTKYAVEFDATGNFVKAKTIH